MKRIVLAALVVGLALVAGTARADTFGVPGATVALPSAGVPNATGSIRLPEAFTTAPAVVETRTPEQLQAVWQSAGAAYGIPWQVLAAINKIESDFGRNMGPSSAGAVGWMQFMPSTWLRWGVDANGDGIADPWNPDDAIYSAARYLAASGGATDVSSAIYSYNHADWYVNEVLALAGVFGQGGVDQSFAVDRVQASLDSAQQQVAVLNQQLVAAEQAEQRLARVHDRLVARVASTTLLSDQLVAQKRAVLAGVRHDAAVAEVARLHAKVVSAEQALTTARSTAQATAVPPSAGSLVSASTSDSGYVFPVGGGPSVVSAGHTHHDYPAVDIAAPAGSPVYALADAIVVRAWHEIDPRCGIGMTVRTNDGLVWTYCHLAYLEPSVQAGAMLSAGASVGLVGSTGHATGPHLHLQLQPPTEWPQRMGWFLSFAGTAFRWNDGGGTSELASASSAPSRDVFAVVSPTAAAHANVVAFTR